MLLFLLPESPRGFSLNYKNAFTKGLLVLIKIQQILNSTAKCGLVLFGKLSAKSHPAVAQSLIKLL